MRATLQEQVFLLGVAGIVSYLCWNCRIASSTLVLIVILGAFLFACVCPGLESFTEKATTLADGGIYQTNVFNCMDLIGTTGEQNYLYALPKIDI
jgi:hypothetical protein